MAHPCPPPSLLPPIHPPSPSSPPNHIQPVLPPLPSTYPVFFSTSPNLYLFFLHLQPLQIFTFSSFIFIPPFFSFSISPLYFFPSPPSSVHFHSQPPFYIFPSNLFPHYALIYFPFPLPIFHSCSSSSLPLTTTSTHSLPFLSSTHPTSSPNHIHPHPPPHLRPLLHIHPIYYFPFHSSNKLASLTVSSTFHPP